MTVTNRGRTSGDSIFVDGGVIHNLASLSAVILLEARINDKRCMPLDNPRAAI